MRTKHLFVLIHIKNKDEADTFTHVSPPGVFLRIVTRWCFFCTSFLLFVFRAYLSYCLVCSLQHCGHLLGKDWPLGSLVFDVFLCFCHFPIWCPGLGVILDCVDF